jgi:hypothetical protein
MSETITCACGQPARPRRPSKRGYVPTKCAECYAASTRESNRLAGQRYRASLTEEDRKQLYAARRVQQQEYRARRMARNKLASSDDKGRLSGPDEGAATAVLEHRRSPLGRTCSNQESTHG